MIDGILTGATTLDLSEPGSNGNEVVTPQSSKIEAAPLKQVSVIHRTKLVTVVEGDPKAPFSIATTPRCRGGRYSIPWIAPLYP